MQCPVDSTTLLMSERMGVEIDYCPTCRGVWLDRGELDKLLERDESRPTKVDDDGHRWKRDEHEYFGKKKKKKGWLSDVFEFD